MARRSKAFYQTFSEVRAECTVLAAISKDPVVPALIACGRNEVANTLSRQVERLEGAVNQHNEELFRTVK